MKRGGILLCFVFVLVLFAVMSLGAPATGNLCGEVTANLTLNTSITTNGTCFTINTSNVVLDGNGTTLRGNNSGFGINASGVSNVAIVNFSTIDGFRIAIYFGNVTNSTIYNNTLTGVNNSLTGAYVVFINTSSDNNNISNNIINSTATGSYPIYVFSSLRTAIFDNIINTTGSATHGIIIDGSSNFTNITMNNISILESESEGIRLVGSALCNISLNVIVGESTESRGISFLNSSDSNTLDSNRISVDGATTTYGIYLANGSNNTFLNDRVNSTADIDFYAETIATDNKITNMILGSGRLNLTTHSFSSVLFDDNTTALVDSAQRAGFGTALALTIANLSSSGYIDYNLSFALQNTDSIDHNSSIRMYRYNESENEWMVVDTSSVDVSLSAVLAGNITQFSTFAPFGDIAASAGRCGVVSSSLTLNRSAVTGNGTCFIINSSNVVLDGNGTIVTGNQSGYGVLANHVINVTIINFTMVDNFTNSVRLGNVTNGTVYNNTLRSGNVSSGHGVYSLWGSVGGNISYNNVNTSGSGGYAIYLHNSSKFTVASNIVSTANSTGYGIYLNSLAQSNIVSSNNITTTGSSAHGIFVSSSNSSTISSNNVTTLASSSFGIYMSASSHSNFTENSVITTGSAARGIHLISKSDFNSFSANVIDTNDTAGFSWGIALEEARNNNFTNDRVNATGTNELYVYDTSTGNIIRNMILLGRANFTTASVNAVTININRTPTAIPAGKKNLSESDYLSIINITGNASIDFNLSYRHSNVSGITNSTIRIHRFEEDTNLWSPLDSSTVDTANNTVSSGNVTSFSLFAALGNVPAEVVADDDNPAGGSSSGGGSGGAGGGVSAGVAGKTEKTVWESIFENERATVEVRNEEFGVTRVAFRVRKTVLGAWLEVLKLESLPEDITGFVKGTYKIFEIKTGPTLTDDVVQNVEISFKVPSLWLTDHLFESDDIALFRYDGEWEELETQVELEEANFVYYKAQSPGFSYFIIGEKAAAAREGEAREEVEEEERIAREEEEEMMKDRGAVWPVVLLIVVAGLAGVGYFVWYMRKKKK